MPFDAYRCWEPGDAEQGAYECEALSPAHAAEMYAADVDFGCSDDRDINRPLRVVVRCPGGDVRTLAVTVEFEPEYTAREEGA